MKNESTVSSPPYGPLSRLKYVFDLLSSSSYPQITSATLKKLKFSGSDAAQTVAALKFLEIIDNEGKKTEKMALLQLKGEEKIQAISGLIKEAYHQLFESTPEANKLKRDDLYNNFILIYGISGRLATTAVPNFLWLCQQGGMDVDEKVEVRDKRVLDRSRPVVAYDTKKTRIDKKISAHPGGDERVVELGEFKLVLPETWSVDTVRQAIAKGKFSKVYEELERLTPAVGVEQAKMEEKES